MNDEVFALENKKILYGNDSDIENLNRARKVKGERRWRGCLF